MKKILLSFACMIMAMNIFAGDLETNYYVTKTGETMDFKKIKIQKEHAHVTLMTGEKAVIDLSQIRAYTLNGKYFEKMPVYRNNENTGKEIFMQFVATRAGLKLYKYPAHVFDTPGSLGFNVNGFLTDVFVVYKGDRLWVPVTEKNYPTLFEFFGVTYSHKI